MRWFPLALALAGCGGASAGGRPEPTTEAPARPAAPMDLEAAQRYVLALVNFDRGVEHLPPVAWDDAAAKAGMGHAADMARGGFTAHLGTSGSTPEERYTEAGGSDFVMENVGCVSDGEAREIEASPHFTADALERVERAFIEEKPPNDGHRKNILTAWHTSFGVGLAAVKGFDIACMSQEFVDDYGDYADVPARAKPGAKVRVAGSLKPEAQIVGVGVARIDMPRPMKPAALNRTHGYAIPKPFANYFPKGFKTVIPVDVKGNDFSIELPLSDGGKPGLYGVNVWAKVPGNPDFVMVSLRTIRVE